MVINSNNDGIPQLVHASAVTVDGYGPCFVNATDDQGRIHDVLVANRVAEQLSYTGDGVSENNAAQEEADASRSLRFDIPKTKHRRPQKIVLVGGDGEDEYEGERISGRHFNSLSQKTTRRIRAVLGR